MRVTPSSATLVDHIYTNNISSPTDAGVTVPDVTDHFGIVYAQIFTSTCTQKGNRRQLS